MYPLRAPSGTVVTRGFPMEKIEGESTDHPHQRAVWFAHDNVNGVDYWNNEFSYTKGVMGHMFVTKVVKAQGGKKSGEIEFRRIGKTTTDKVVLVEDRKTTFYAGGPNRVIDFDFTLTAKDAVTFKDGKDGVFGIRVARVWKSRARRTSPRNRSAQA